MVLTSTFTGKSIAFHVLIHQDYLKLGRLGLIDPALLNESKSCETKPGQNTWTKLSESDLKGAGSGFLFLRIGQNQKNQFGDENKRASYVISKVCHSTNTISITSNVYFELFTWRNMFVSVFGRLFEFYRSVQLVIPKHSSRPIFAKVLILCHLRQPGKRTGNFNLTKVTRSLTFFIL